MESRVTAALRQAFKPEFLNRIDEIVIFNSLGREHIKKIVEIQLGRLKRMLSDRKITLEVTEQAKGSIAEKGYDPVYGARPLKRVIQKLIQDPLASRILAGEYKDGDKIRIDSDGENLHFSSAGQMPYEEARTGGVLH
jgi:ATP-dependent Clp protease ATP-binding subunit ClpB